jgi:rod shape-determining protein MreB
VVIHPLEKIEGGLSQVEERLFHELAVGAGASKVVVWAGAPLSDAEVAAKLQGK